MIIRALLVMAAILVAETSLAEMPLRKVIEWGWDEPDTKFIRENIEMMEQHPFDGLVFHVSSNQGGNFTWEMWGGRKYELGEFLHSIDNLKATSFHRFTDRFLRVNVTPGTTDWFDDEAWETVLNNFGVAAQVARQGGCKGFMFDVEQYNEALFDYAKQKHQDSRTFEEYGVKIRQRGREWIAEVNRHFPEITVLLPFGYRIAQPPEGKSRSESHYGLLADFLDGMLEACSEQTKIVDAWEYSYPYKEHNRFEEAYATIKKESVEWTAQPEKYQRHVEAGFGIWMDCHWRQVGWNVDDFSSNHFTPAEFQTSVRSALRVSDQYVWIYTEQPRWWTNERLPVEYVTALKQARMTADKSATTLHILYDNYSYDDALQTDWGFACLVTGSEQTILFDTGRKGDLLLSNMEKMNLSPKDVDVIVISHNHGDHTGGLLPFLKENSDVRVFLPAETQSNFLKEVEQVAANVAVVNEPTKVCEGVLVLGPTGDTIIEQALVVDTTKGLVIITGCSHPSIEAIAQQAEEATHRDIYMILGGTHLLRHSDDNLRAVIDDLQELGVQRVAPTHCSGDKAILMFRDTFGDRFVKMGVGRTIEIDTE